MKDFSYEQLPRRVVFGVGASSRVLDEVRRLRLVRVMLITGGATKSPGDDIAAQLRDLVACRWDEVLQHVPVGLAERARIAASQHAVDGIVSVGGGSTTGLAKAVALTHRLPIVAVPTTYAGSEQTTIYGVTDGQHKRTGHDVAVLPKVAVYDPALTTALPPSVTGPSAFNALAHSIEALYAPGCNPVTSSLALEAINAIARSLPAVMSDPAHLESRSDLLYGAYLAGVALGATASGFHHKICHVLGGLFGLVHADAHSVVLPHAVAFNAPALPSEMAWLAAALRSGDGDPAGALWDLARASRVPTSLADLVGHNGPLRRDDLQQAAAIAVAEVAAIAPPGNPRPVTESDVLSLLERAFDGERPAPDPLSHAELPPFAGGVGRQDPS